MSQPERAALHNQLSGEIVKQIIKPMMESGASFSSVLVLLESVITGVLLALSATERWSPAQREIYLRKLVSGVRNRVDEIERTRAAKK